MKAVLTGGLAFGALVTVALIETHAQTLSAAEQQLVVENLAQADANADGMLTRDEFEVLINLNAEDGIGRAAQIVRAGLYDRAFSRVDADGDGVLTQSELQSVGQQSQG